MKFNHPDGEPILVLSEDQSWELLASRRHGRLAFSGDGQLDIFPVNYGVQDRTLLFRTAPGSKLRHVALGHDVVFEIDHATDGEGWSVIVRGKATWVENPREIAAAEELNLTSWLPTTKDNYIRLTPTEVSGRHFEFVSPLD